MSKSKFTDGALVFVQFYNHKLRGKVSAVSIVNDSTLVAVDIEAADIPTLRRYGYSYRTLITHEWAVHARS